MWRVISREKERVNPLMHSRYGHEDEILEFALSKDGKWLATASADRTVKLWKVPSLEQVQVFGKQPDLVSVLAFATGKKGSLFAARMDGTSKHYSFDEVALMKQEATGLGPTLNPVRSTAAAKDIKKLKEAKSSKSPQKVFAPVEISGVIAKADEVDA
jgi:WD40 repeat protein